MKVRCGLLLAAGVAGVLGLCVAMTGCGGDDNMGDVVDTSAINLIDFDTPFVSGSSARSADGYSGTYTFINGMDVRLTVNDAKTPGVIGRAYNLQPSLVAETGAFTHQGNVFTAQSFVSPRTQMKYKFMGWAIKSSSAALTMQNPLTLTSFSGTLRAYWATVE